MAHTVCLVCLVSIVSGHCKNTLGRASASSRHMTNLEQSTFLIYLWWYSRHYGWPYLVVSFSVVVLPSVGHFKRMDREKQKPGNTKGGSITVLLTSRLTGFGLVRFANNSKNCQLSYSRFLTSQTGGQWYSDTAPFSIPCKSYLFLINNSICC